MLGALPGRHAQGPQDAAARAEHRRRRRRRRGDQPHDPVLGARLQGLGDRQRGDARPARARPLGLHRAAPAAWPRAWTATPGQLQSLITDLRTTAGAFAARDDAAAATRSASCRARCAPASPRSPRVNDALPSLRRFAADLRPGVRSPARRSTRRSRSSASCAASSARASCAAWPPTCARRSRRSPSSTRRRSRCSSRSARRRAARTRSSCRGRSTRSRTRTSRRSGPVYQEQPKPLVGLAGESRTFDANGQWFRVALNAAQYATPLGNGQFLLTDRPLLGANPPQPAKRPPLRPDVPCETQEQPDLRTNPAAPPSPSFKVREAPADAEAAARAKAVDWLERRGQGARPGPSRSSTRSLTRPTCRSCRQAPDLIGKADAMKKAIRDHARDFAAIIALVVDRARRRRLHPRQPAPALPGDRGEAEAAQGRVLDRAGRHARPGPDRPRLRREDRRRRQGRADEGRAVVTFEILPKYKDLIREDATALLRPKTALKDMFIEVEPGDGQGRAARASRSRSRTRCPTSTPTRSSRCSTATRATTCELLVNGAGQGLKGRGDELREVFQRFEPTHRDLARVTTKVAERRAEPAPPGHAPQPAQRRARPPRTTTSPSSSTRRRACSARSPRRTRTSPRRSSELPARCAQTTRHARQGRDVRRTSCGPSLEQLRPAVRADRRGQRRAPAARRGGDADHPRRDPPVRARGAPARARPAPGGARRSPTSTPDLTRSFVVLNHLFNMIGFNEDGREGPDDADARRGLPVLARLARPQRRRAVLDRRRRRASSARSRSRRPARRSSRRRRGARARVPAGPHRRPASTRGSARRG